MSVVLIRYSTWTDSLVAFVILMLDTSSVEVFTIYWVMAFMLSSAM